MQQGEYEWVAPEIGVVGLKLTKDMRDEFKAMAHSKGSTMQTILEAFIAMYIKDPDIITLQTQVTMKIFNKEA